jgi:hypothetical protein
MKRDARIEMVLGVVRQIPHQEAGRPHRHGGPRVREAVVVIAAPRVLAQEVEAQERQPERERQQPVPEQRIGTHGKRAEREGSQDEQRCPHGANDLRPHGRRHEVEAVEAPAG